MCGATQPLHPELQNSGKVKKRQQRWIILVHPINECQPFWERGIFPLQQIYLLCWCKAPLSPDCQEDPQCI